jgi:hypothetical protein
MAKDDDKGKKNKRARLENWVYGPRKHKHTDRILIAHLGNLAGIQEERQNTPAYLQAALAQGFAVACSVVAAHGAFLLPAARGYCRLPYAAQQPADVVSRRRRRDA